MDFKLEVGAVSDSVEVQAEATLVETGSATVGKVIENRRIEDLPLNGRNAMAMVMLTPSVKSGAGAINSGWAGASDGGRGWVLSGISINGGVSGSNNYTLDGGLNENDQYGDININPTVDSIEEFKVQTGTMQAEFGRTGGGVINIVTKSGTNQFHGTLYEFIRNDAIQARNTFAAVKEPLEVQPVWRSHRRPDQDGIKTFFASLTNEGYRTYLQYSDPIGTVPTVAERSGDFST